MQLPKDCAQLATALAVQAEVADKAADQAGRNKSKLFSLNTDLDLVSRTTNLGQMATTWFAKIGGMETDRLAMISAEKRFKHAKGLVAGAQSIAAATNAYALAAAELAAFFPVLAEALEALALDMKKGQDEGWLDMQNADEATATKQRKVYESASWFWALHARLADLQYAAEDKRIEASELSAVTKTVLAQAIGIIDAIPDPPSPEDPPQQIVQVQKQMRGAKTILRESVSHMAGLLEGEFETGASAAASTTTCV
jgi:hypothetical protein